MKIWNKITNEPWATTSDTLENIINIAKRQNANPAAIAAQLGRKLQSTYAVSVRNNVAVIPIHGPLFRYAIRMENGIQPYSDETIQQGIDLI